jgi:AcrR family transcriptional regulator
LEAAKLAFRKRGFAATTTRDIANAAGIATGTLFNYFATKEAIIEFLAAEALASVRSQLDEVSLEDSLEEALFAYVAAELRQLKPLRKFIPTLLETSLCPLAVVQPSGANGELRAAHLETVVALTRQHGIAELSAVALQVYWTLYIGVLTFWSNDKSPKQEDTLALLDQSLSMFAAWLESQPHKLPK